MAEVIPMLVHDFEKHRDVPVWVIRDRRYVTLIERFDRKGMVPVGALSHQKWGKSTLTSYSVYHNHKGKTPKIEKAEDGFTAYDHWYVTESEFGRKPTQEEDDA